MRLSISIIACLFSAFSRVLFIVICDSYSFKLHYGFFKISGLAILPYNPVTLIFSIIRKYPCVSTPILDASRPLNKSN